MLNKEQDESFGIVPLTKAKGYWEVFLIQHKHGRYWGFPKGHKEKDETPQAAALRELKEETNLELIKFLKQEPLMEQYNFILDGRRIFKSVYYFIAEVNGEIILQKKEISGGVWLTFSDALEKLTHSEGKAILKQVEKILPVLL